MIRFGYYSKPRFLIVGAQKAGTTALYYYLAEHPNLIPSSEKEIEFFTPELFADWPEHPHHLVLGSRNSANFFDPRTYSKAASWYHSHFPLPYELGPHRLTYEATPEYLYYPKTAERIFTYNSNVKLIVLLRDPVERAFSAWSMYSNFGEGDYRPLIYAPRRENRGFDEAVRDEIKQLHSCNTPLEPGYVRRGLYHEQLVRYFKFFKRDQILILDSRALKNETSSVVNKVIDFLGLPEYKFQKEWTPIHVAQNRTQIPATTAQLLRDFYQPHNESLYKLLDHDFSWQ
ncbi:MAG TPA: sulfotransferase domain-containing protein [Anaerolineales bacterium]|nr:sulfotransferase domain-containing protein [Anaerolineales bacterium]